MKQMKFFLVALMAVVIGISVTSCMKGDDNTIVQRNDFVRVVDDFPVYFKDMAGNKLIPTTAIMNAEEKIALIYYQYDRATLAENATSVNITLLSDPYYIKESYVSSSSLVANAPVMTLEPSTPYGLVTGGFFDKNTLIIPIAYKFKKYEKQEDQVTELKRHSFELSYDAETGFSNGKLTLRLSHVAQTIQGEDGEVEERKDNTYEYKAFNLSAILSKLASTPTKITIVIDQNEKDDKFKDNVKDAEFSYPYTFKE